MTFDSWIKRLSIDTDNDINFFQFLGLIDQMNEDMLPSLSETTSDLQAKAILLKISNLLVNKFQYKHRHDYLVSKPLGLIVDPANGCTLHCPGCLHNKEFSEKISPDWPNAILSEEKFTSFLENYGSYATLIAFFNWGEPLINKFTPQFIKIAKSYMLKTSLSSNLSIDFDADALVLSGLDYMTLSIDGTTAKTYNLYRQGGDFNKVIENAKKLVTAKKKYNMKTPFLSWQFLLYEHNENEVETAKEMGKTLGVNDIKFVHPYDIPWNQELKIAQGAKPECYAINTEIHSFFDGDNIKLNHNIERNYANKWQDLAPHSTTKSLISRSSPTCKWLYQNLVMDAMGRFLPCCYSPRKNSGMTFIFSDFETGNDHFNSKYYRFSRNSFLEKETLALANGKAAQLPNGDHTSYCVACKFSDSIPHINKTHIANYLGGINNQFGIIDATSINLLTY